MTTPTGIPITLCTDCNREHPVTRQHRPVCGLAWPCALVARHIFTREQIRAAVGASTGGKA